MNTILLGLAILVVGGFLWANGLFLLGPLLHLRALICGMLPLLVFLPITQRWVHRLAENVELNRCESILYSAFSAMVLAGGVSFLLLTLHITYPPVFLLIAALSFIYFVPWWKQKILSLWKGEINLSLPKPSVGETLLLVVLFGVVTAAAVLPPLGYDAHEYHLAVAQRDLQTGGWVAFSDNVYAGFPMNMEMLYLWPLAVHCAAGCTGINLLFALMAALAVAGLISRWGSADAALTAVIVFLSTGLVLLLIKQADIDIALAGSAGVLLLSYERLRSRVNRLDGLLMTLALGFGLGAKYIAALSLLVPFWVMVAVDILLNRRKDLIRPCLLILFGSALLIVPWLIRNLILYHNPVYPLLYSLWGGTPPFFADLFRAAHAPPIESVGQRWGRFWGLPLQKSFAGSLPWGFSCLWVLGISILPALRRNHPLLRVSVFVITAYTLWFFFTQRNDRFLATLLPFLAVIPVYAVTTLDDSLLKKIWRGILYTVVAAQLWAALGAVVSQETADFLFMPTLEEDYFAHRLPHYRAIAWLNDLQNQEQNGGAAKVGEVLFVGEAQTFGARFPVVAPTVFNFHPLQKGLNPNVTHIVFNQFELDRLRKGYGPLGWPLGEALQSWMDQNRGKRLTPVFDAYPESPGKIVVYAVKTH